MAGAVRRSGLALALPALVGLSTLLHWLAGRRLGGLWILPDEGVYGARMIGFWRDGHLPSPHGYSVLYPLLAGFPFATGTVAAGLASTKLLQALIVSLAAAPVFLYGRRIMRPGWALAAAALTVASPLLLLSGLLMTETLFYPLAAWTLLAIAHAVATARGRDQVVALVLVALAVLTRTQAVVLVAVFALAVLVDAALQRRREGLRWFWPIGALLLVGVLAVAVRPGLLGAYSVAVGHGYPLGAALRLSVEHLALIVLSTVVLPTAALLLLTVEAARARLREPAARALVATALAALVLLPLQVGVFAARFAPHLLERDLAALPPLLFLVLALWLDRGAPRPPLATGLVALGLAALLLLAPWNHLTTSTALPDSFSLALLQRFSSPADAVAIAVPVALLALLVPRRGRVALPALVAAALVAASVAASSTVAARVRTENVDEVGPVPDWIDRTASGPVAYLYAGEGFWTTVWQERFWNRRIRSVLALAPVPGPMAQTPVELPPSGLLPTSARWVVASDTLHLDGTPVAHLAQTDLDVTGLTLWRVSGRARLSFVEHGIQPNGDMTTVAHIRVYGCDGGTLQLTLLPKATHRLRVLVNRKPVLDQPLSGESAQVSVPAPAHTPTGECTFAIVPQSLLGSTVITFERPD